MATAKKKPAKKTGGKAANAARMKKAMAKAKAIRKASPNKKWTTCVKEAWKK